MASLTPRSGYNRSFVGEPAGASTGLACFVYNALPMVPGGTRQIPGASLLDVQGAGSLRPLMGMAKVNTSRNMPRKASSGIRAMLKRL